MPESPARPTRRVTLSLFALSVLGLGALTLLPIGWTLNRFVVWLYYEGLQLWRFPVLRDISMDALGGLLNVVLMVPVAALAGLAAPRARWWHIGVGILLLSSAIETAQHLVPLGRQGSAWDVATNTLGGLFGALLASLTRESTRPRRERRPGSTECPPPAA